MTAAVAVMAATTPPSSLPKRHGFSIESLIGKPDSPPPSPSPRLPPPPPSHLQLQQHHQHLRQLQQYATSPASPIMSTTKSVPNTTPTTPPSRPLPIKPLPKDLSKENERETTADIDRETLLRREQDVVMRAREIRNLREKEARSRDREIDIIREKETREREMVIESMRERERELRDIRELKERAELAREREIQQRNRDCVDSRNGPLSYPVKSSPQSHTPPSPLLEKSVSPSDHEKRLSAWGGEEFKHLLGGFPAGHLDSNGMYQPLRVCNRTLASINGLGGSPAATGPLSMGLGPQFSHLPINPFFARDLPPHHTHPLLAARYPGFMHHRYPMGPPPGLLFHPYRKPKRNRTAFSPNQLLQLEQAFEKNHYVVGQERKSLAAKLQLTETQVKVWFQNRRTKHKRMKAEEDGGSSGSHPDGHHGDSGRGDDGSDLMTYMDHDDDEHITSDEEDEELSVTEDS